MMSIYVKRFIVLIMVGSVLSLVWSMANYYQYIQSQLWSSSSPEQQFGLGTDSKYVHFSTNERTLKMQCYIHCTTVSHQI